MSTADAELRVITSFLESFNLAAIDGNFEEMTSTVNETPPPPNFTTISPSKACRARPSWGKHVAVSEQLSELFQLQAPKSCSSRAKSGQNPRCKPYRRKKRVPIEKQRIYNRTSAEKKSAERKELRLKVIQLEHWYCMQLEAAANNDTLKSRSFEDKMGIIRGAQEKVEALQQQAKKMRWDGDQQALVENAVDRLKKLMDMMSGSCAD